MIYKVISEEEVQAITGELKLGFPGSAKIYYILRNYLEGLMKGFEVIVDCWPVWSCIIVRPGPDDEIKIGERTTRSTSKHDLAPKTFKVFCTDRPFSVAAPFLWNNLPATVPGYFKHFYICFGKSVASLKFFIQRPGVIDWTQPATFTGVPYDILPVIHEVCRKRGGHLPYIEPRFMYCWSSKPPEPPEIPDNIKLTTLLPEHAEQLRSDWKDVRGDTDLDIYFRRIIENFDSSALLGDKGELLAYICMQFNGSMAMLHVKNKHRGNGYGEMLLRAMTHKLLSKQEVAYGFVPTTDRLGIKKAQILGYTWVPQGNMVWVRYLPSPKPIKVTTGGSNTAEALATSDDEEEPNMFINAIPLAVNKKSLTPNCFTSS